jgi:hypothetical protein
LDLIGELGAKKGLNRHRDCGEIYPMLNCDVKLLGAEREEASAISAKDRARVRRRGRSHFVLTHLFVAVI